MAAPAASQSWKGRTAPPFEPGEVFGCWEIVRPAEPDTMGRARYEARARCCGRKVVKNRHDLLRCAPACSHCVDRRAKKGGPEPAQRSGATRTGRLNRCTACGQPGHKRSTCAPKVTEALPWLRCALAVAVTTGVANQQVRPFVCCGALVKANKARAHVQDVHGLDVDEAAALSCFVGVDPRQGAGG